jgi:hypothetical protein
VTIDAHSGMELDLSVPENSTRCFAINPCRRPPHESGRVAVDGTRMPPHPTIEKLPLRLMAMVAAFVQQRRSGLHGSRCMGSAGKTHSPSTRLSGLRSERGLHQCSQQASKLAITLPPAVNRISFTYALYYRLITNKTWAGRYPTPQYDWFKGFTYAWLTPEFKPFEPPG